MKHFEEIEISAVEVVNACNAQSLSCPMAQAELDAAAAAAARSIEHLRHARRRLLQLARMEEIG